jgi:hypothetical protein
LAVGLSLFDLTIGDCFGAAPNEKERKEEHE